MVMQCNIEYSVRGFTPQQIPLESKGAIMKDSIRNLALATALTVSAGGVLAQQQQYGRDSVYADPAQATRQARLTADTAAEPRLGRSSVYATASSTPSNPVTADATRLQRYGRASVYATPLDNLAGDTSQTQIGSVPSDRSAN
jgi:hypothetical protein